MTTIRPVLKIFFSLVTLRILLRLTIQEIKFLLHFIFINESIYTHRTPPFSSISLRSPDALEQDTAKFIKSNIIDAMSRSRLVPITC